MSYDLLIEPTEDAVFDRQRVDQILGGLPQLRRYDAESYRTAGGLEVVLGADRPGLPVDSIMLHIPYVGLPESFETGCDLAFSLAEQLGGRVVDAQLGRTLVVENRAEARGRAEEAARWAARLGTQFTTPRAFVDEPTTTTGAVQNTPPAGDSARPWWKFWARD